MLNVSEQTYEDRCREVLREIENLHWLKNARGNWGADYYQMKLTAFQRHGFWHWCIADDGDVRFSNGRGFETPEEAIDALESELFANWV